MSKTKRRKSTRSNRNKKSKKSTGKELLLKRYTEVRQHSIEICSSLETEDYVAHPQPTIGPPKWHLAHTSWYIERYILQTYQKDYELFNEDYHALFRAHDEEAHLPRREYGYLGRPTVEDVLRYRMYVDASIEDLLEKQKRVSPKLRKLVERALHHEQQHQELLFCDIKYILGTQPQPTPFQSDTILDHKHEDHHSKNFLKFEEGLYDIGAQSKDFLPVNETPQHKVFLHAFELQDRLVSNGEYIQFMKAGGYERPELWSIDGWRWREQQAVEAPLYWEKGERLWWYYSLAGKEKVPAQAPVMHVSYYEAEAFANWKNMRLPTEAEWEVAAAKLDHGHLWEWTASAHAPYPGFRLPRNREGLYSHRFGVNRQVLRGGSCASAKELRRSTARHYLTADARYQFTGIRLAKQQKI